MLFAIFSQLQIYITLYYLLTSEMNHLLSSVIFRISSSQLKSKHHMQSHGKFQTLHRADAEHCESKKEQERIQERGHE